MVRCGLWAGEGFVDMGFLGGDKGWDVLDLKV